jgi:small subunit ribosomal protein S17
MKTLQGKVVSAKTPKTVTVTVTRKWKHPLYKKYVKITKNYACHVEGMDIKEGDMVTIQECRPMSKTKTFIVTEKLEKVTEKVSE